MYGGFLTLGFGYPQIIQGAWGRPLRSTFQGIQGVQGQGAVSPEALIGNFSKQP